MNKLKQLETELQKHKDNYIHIPKFSLYPLLGTIIFGILSWLNLYLLDWELIEVLFSNREVIKQYIFHTAHLINIYPLIGEYILISLFFISVVALFKKGYRNIKGYDEDGLIFGLIVGLIFGLIFGLIVGLIVGLISGLISGLIFGLISGLIFGLISGLISGLIFGLIFGLISGLINECKEDLK